MPPLPRHQDVKSDKAVHKHWCRRETQDWGWGRQKGPEKGQPVRPRTRGRLAARDPRMWHTAGASDGNGGVGMGSLVPGQKEMQPSTPGNPRDTRVEYSGAIEWIGRQMDGSRRHRATTRRPDQPAWLPPCIQFGGRGWKLGVGPQWWRLDQLAEGGREGPGTLERALGFLACGGAAGAAWAANGMAVAGSVAQL